MLLFIAILLSFLFFSRFIAILMILTPQSLLRMWYCPKFLLRFLFVGIILLEMFDDFSFFEKNDFWGLPHLFLQFFWYIRACSGHAASKAIYAGKFLFAYFEKNNFWGLPRPFFTIFWYIRACSGRAASKAIYAGKFLFAYFEST